jgi:hypothetical protein
MPKRRKIGQCALCGDTRPATREHVPPKNLFLAPRPTNTITVPVCEPCNHGYHLDDEYFRVYVAAGAESGTRQWRLWKEKVVGSSFARGEGLKGRLNDDHAIIVHYHQHVEPLQTFDDHVIGDGLLPLVQPFDAARINAVVEKIVRCLHFFLSGTPLSRSARFDVDTSPLTDAELHALFEKRTGYVGDHKEFIYRRDQVNTVRWHWLLAFYVQHTFAVRIYAS